VNREGIFVFVYGTLCTDQPNHELLLNADLVSRDCRTSGRMFDTGNGFPAMLPANEGVVYGELYKINKKTLKELDRLEGYRGPGYHNHYERIKCLVFLQSSVIKSYVYVYTSAKVKGLSQIQSGRWTERTNMFD